MNREKLIWLQDDLEELNGPRSLIERIQDTWRYREFRGEFLSQMHNLLADGRAPLSVSDFMKRRLEVRSSSGQGHWRRWFDYDFSTGDAIAYHPDGRAKIILDSQQLRESNEEIKFKGDDLIIQSRVRGGSIIIQDGLYEKLQGFDLNKNELEKYASGVWLKQEEVKSNPIWQTLARDEDLLKEYIDLVFSQNYDITMAVAMAVVYREFSQEVPIMRPWGVGSLDKYSRSNIWNGTLGNSQIISRLMGLHHKYSRK